jgi:hypothetical protein
VYLHTNDAAQKHEIGNDIIKSVKAYKNGKFEVQLNSESDAKKVAEALIRYYP